jgi:hypothetical protein
VVVPEMTRAEPVPSATFTAATFIMNDSWTDQYLLQGRISRKDPYVNGYMPD